jgi:hypothetical protein
MGFNNCPSKKSRHGELDEHPASTWYFDQAEWDAVRTGHASETWPPVELFTESIHDGDVVSINYAHEVLLRQRGVK